LDKIKLSDLGQNWRIWSWFIIRPVGLLDQTVRDKFSLEQKRIKSVRVHYAQHNTAKTFNAKANHLSMISFARVNSATLLSAKVNHLIKCTFYENTPLERPN